MSAASFFTLIDILHPSGWMNLRAIRAGEKPICRNILQGQTDRLERFIEEYYDRYNLFFGVAPRKSEFGGRLENCEGLYALFTDHDFKEIPEAEARRKLAEFPVPPSAMVSSGAGLHSYWFLKASLPVAGNHAARSILQTLARTLGADRNSAEPARVLRIPDTLNFKYDPARAVELEFLEPTRLYSIDEILSHLPPITVPDVDPGEPYKHSLTAEQRIAKAKQWLAEREIAVEGEGGRQKLLENGVALLRGFDLEVKEALEALADWNARCQPPWKSWEIEREFIGFEGFGTEPIGNRLRPASEREFKLTETGDAEHFAARFGDRVRYDHARGRWVVFGGHRWEPQSNGEVDRLALEAIRARQKEAFKIDDEDKRKKALGWTLGGEARKRRSNLLALAQSVKPIADSGEGWDSDNWLLGVPNGVVDLRTGELRSGRPEDLITKMTAAPWNPEATSALWDSVLERALPDPEVRAFLQKIAGLTLAGLTGENILSLFHGVTRSSKGTILDAIKSALGDYARAADLSTLARRRFEDGGAPRPDLINLVGARMVAIYEAGKKFKLDTALVKTLSGSDAITARTLHEKPITFYPSFIIWLATDTRPGVPDDDSAFFERLCEIPFEVHLKPEERDPNVRERLKSPEHGAAILAWAFRGLRAYLEAKKLARPAAVEAANVEYRRAMEPSRGFFDEVLEFRKEAWASVKALRAAYVDWCEEEGERPESSKRFAESLKARGASPETATVARKTVRGWQGVGIRDAGVGEGASEGEERSSEEEFEDNLPF